MQRWAFTGTIDKGSQVTCKAILVKGQYLEGCHAAPRVWKRTCRC